MSRSDLTTPWADREELRKLLAAARDTNPRDFLLVALLGLNGLRVSEAVGATVADLGSSGGHRTLRVTRKGSKRGVVPLAPIVCRTVDEFLAGRSEGPLLPRLHASGAVLDPLAGISRQTAYERVRHLADWAGVNRELSPHSLRRSFVTLALQDGAPLHQVQLAVGHSSPTTTMLYFKDAGNLDHNPTFQLAEDLCGLQTGATP
jgi:integrase/recombinase XerD